MFLIDCPDHGSPVLVTERRIRSLRNTDAGILLEVECWCGRRVALLTGRSAGEAATARTGTVELARTGC